MLKFPIGDKILNSYLVIDTTFVTIPKPVNDDIQKRTYSGKHKGNGLKLQGVCCVNTGLLVLIDGPFFGSIHDSLIYLHTLHQYQLNLLGDKAYFHFENIITPIKNKYLTGTDILFNQRFSKIRVIIERCFGRFKNWEIVKHYRGRIENLSKIIHVVAHLTNIKIKFNPLKNIKIK